MSPLAALKSALRTALAADGEIAAATGGQPVYDHPPASAAFPCLGFGRVSLQDWPAAAEPGAEILLTLDIWSRARGTAEVSRLACRVEHCLAAGLTAEPFTLVNLAPAGCEIRYDPAAEVHHAALTLRAVIEAAT